MKIRSEQEMLTFGEQFAKNIAQQNPSEATVIELLGDVGAGKTTFTRGLAKGLGIKAPVTSPSFTISKSYALPNGNTLTHYDFYRLKDPGLMADDLQEKIKNGNPVIIEWGNSVKNLLPKNHIAITILKNDDGSREISVQDNRASTFSGVFAPYEAQLSAGSPVTTGRAKRLPKSIDRLSNRSDIMQLYLDTSTPTTILKLNDKTYTWESGRDLAENLLQFIKEKLEENHATWQDLASITFMSGPGSFTGLRIGAAVVNTLAHELNIPLYNHHGEQVKIIIPDYGRAANITAPRK